MPKAKHKWPTASVVNADAAVIAAILAEAEQHDPGHGAPWVALVDGNNH